jgi:8-oxo-dGTP pyrophosphatase MutT (NUDIX family)
MIRNWEILKRELVNDYRLLQVEKKQVRSPRTGTVSDVLALKMPSWVLVLPLTPDDEVVMVRQYRHGIEQVCLELPGGLVDPDDESPEKAVKRELLEETGYRTSRLDYIGECYPQPALLTNQCFFFVGRNPKRVREPSPDDGEDIEIINVPLESIPDLIQKKEITHGMVLLAFFFLWMNQGHLGVEK